MRPAVASILIAAALIGDAGCSPAPPTMPSTPAPLLYHAAPGNPRIFLSAGNTLRASRFLLFADGRFTLQYTDAIEYRGTFADNDGTITFDWDASSAAGPWAATGHLDGRTLSIQFNEVMVMADFEDTVYTLVGP